MSLTTALNMARSSLTATAGQSAIISRNVANAGNASATRKLPKLVTMAGGGVLLQSVARASNDALTSAMLDATSRDADKSEVVSVLDALNATVGDVSQDSSPAALIGKLDSALQQLAAAPQSTAGAQSAVSAAKDLALALNNASAVVEDLRRQSETDIGASVVNLNTLLQRFGTVNSEIVHGSQAGQDVTDALDARDGIIADIANEIGVRVVRRENNDIALYTDSGVTLFETKARNVTFDPTGNLGPGTSGRSVYVDGVPVTGNGVAMGIGSGRLAGLSQIRDEVTVTYQKQLDEIARGLVASFAESDQSGSGLPDRAGLFTYDGAPAVPAAGQIVNRIAAKIRVAASVDPSQGGDVNRLRDGAISAPGNAAYLYNTTGAAGFTNRLSELQSNLATLRPFDPTAQAQKSSTMVGYASSSVAWLQEQRKVAASASDYAGVVKERAASALSNDTGVNIDTEMSNMLELERSYQATAKLISTIDGMFGSLINAIG